MNLKPPINSPTRTISSRLEIARRNIEFARLYTLTLLENVTDQEWYWSPAQPVTHIAWQCGHIAMAQYGLTLFRQRGRAAIDANLMSAKFRKQFMKGSQPSADRNLYPQPGEIRGAMDAVHAQMQREISNFDGDQLDEPSEEPHAAFATRYGALLFAADHEMLHAGQIGLLRRMMGKPPLR